MNSIIEKYKNPIIYLITLLGLFALWLTLAWTIDSNLILPSPINTIKELFRFFKDGSFYLSVLTTLLRAFIAFSLSFIIAFLLVIISIKESLRKSIKLIIGILRGIPTMAIILILIIWVKSAITPVVVSMLVLIPLLYDQLLGLLNSFKEEYSPIIKIYSINKKKIAKIFFAENKHYILDYAASGTNLGLKVCISAEAIALSYYGLGSLMQMNKIYLEMEKLFALALISVIIGVLIEFLIRLLKKWLVKEID